jgi:hypothetical protein
MGAWGTTLDPTGKSGIRFLADPHGELTSALDLSFDGAAIFGNARSKRYALVVENGKVTKAHVEPDNTGLDGMSFSLSLTGRRFKIPDTFGHVANGELIQQLALPRRCLEMLKSGTTPRSGLTRLVNTIQTCKKNKKVSEMCRLSS